MAKLSYIIIYICSKNPPFKENCSQNQSWLVEFGNLQFQSQNILDDATPDLVSALKTSQAKILPSRYRISPIPMAFRLHQIPNKQFGF